MSDNIGFETMYSDTELAHGVPAATPWDVGRAQTFVKRLAALGAIRGDVLAPGSGPGHNEIFLASQGFSVTGVEGSASAVERARASAQSAGVSVDFRVGDATTLDGFDAAFDTVVDSAFFHALTLDEDAQVRYLNSVHRASRPRARLYMCEFGTGNVNGVVSPMPLSEDAYRQLLADAGWTITYLGTTTYTVSISVAKGPNGDSEVMEPLKAPLQAVEPFLVDGRVDLPFWEIHATREDSK